MRPSREYVKNEPGRTVLVRRLTLPRFEFQWHHHPEFELTLILHGRGTRLVGDCFDEFAPGDFVLLGPSLPHTWISEPEDGVPAEAVFVHFDRDALGNWEESDDFDHLLRKSGRGLVFSSSIEEPRTQLLRAANEPDRLKHMIHFISSLVALAAEPGSGSLITSTAYEMSAPSARPSSRRIEDRVDIAHAMITDSYPHTLDFQLVAERAGMSEAGFSRFFRRATGRTFTTYVQEVRIAEACRLLGETELTVTYIAHRSGFGSVTQFNRIFRRLKGCTPSQWRQRTG